MNQPASMGFFSMDWLTAENNLSFMFVPLINSNLAFFCKRPNISFECVRIWLLAAASARAVDCRKLRSTARSCELGSSKTIFANFVWNTPSNQEACGPCWSAQAEAGTNSPISPQMYRTVRDNEIEHYPHSGNRRPCRVAGR